MIIFYALIAIVVIIALVKIQSASGEVENEKKNYRAKSKRVKEQKPSSEGHWWFPADSGGSDHGGFDSGGGFDGGSSDGGGDSSSSF